MENNEFKEFMNAVRNGDGGEIHRTASCYVNKVYSFNEVVDALNEDENLRKRFFVITAYWIEHHGSRFDIDDRNFASFLTCSKLRKTAWVAKTIAGEVGTGEDHDAADSFVKADKREPIHRTLQQSLSRLLLSVLNECARSGNAGAEISNFCITADTICGGKWFCFPFR